MAKKFYYQTIRSNPVFVNFGIKEEINSVGDYLGPICINKQDAVNDSLIFYKDGIKEFDTFLNGEPEYHFHLSMQMASYINAFVFFLYHPEHKKYAVKTAIWRDRILGVFYHKENKDHTLTKPPKTNKWFTKFNPGESIPEVLSLHQLNDKPKKSHYFTLEKENVRIVSLKYRNLENSIEEIKIYIRAKQKKQLMECLSKHFVF
ncbi:hypothetical protein [uncultured Planktosalinus sp.]|uniref:hypothetical protein n=1 Tax=uncultured Planktosalinus sp. TaxID=1810935 RepID=UPI0030D8813D